MLNFISGLGMGGGPSTSSKSGYEPNDYLMSTTSEKVRLD
jgi:hypothetical protein